ncbi:46490_t:CDS:2 [Gigaspora margarita]|uniref:46490_t:CDS:1 n=1 Tax=Gigaspora margarita TaxID=4874 RepID=A0ABN7UJ48_GIGMA|nr:46490_t:CDS:2 [Gigaspora margarita]
MTFDMFYVQRIARSGNRYYVCKICGSYQRNLSNEHINYHSPQQRVYYRNLFNRNQYPLRRITAGSTSNPGQTTTTSTSSNQPLKITMNSGLHFLAAVHPASRATTSTSSVLALVVDVMPESQAASDEEESSDSTWLPAEFSEQSTKESTEESSEQKNEVLKRENEAFKIVISHSVGTYSNNKERYESTIQQQINEINNYRQIIQSIASYCQENSIVNHFLQLNEIDTRICYSSFNDAVNASNNPKKFIELNQDETEIEEPPQLYHTFSFIEVGENETISDEEGECSKYVNGNNNFEVKNSDEKEIYDTEMFEF